VNRCLPLNNAYPPKIPLSYGSSYGSFGSHGSYTGNTGLASSYGSVGDVNNINMYYSPLGSSGFTQVHSSPDVRLRPRLSHDRGIRLSPGSLGHMSLGASPTQFTPPNYQMQIPANSAGKHGSGSPACGGMHGSPLGKVSPASPYSMRRNLAMPPHEYASQYGQGRYGDGVSYSHSDAYVQGHTGYSKNAGPTHSSWRPQISSRSGFSMETSTSHGPSHAFHSQAPTRSFDFSPNTSAPSALDPANWDPDYRYEKTLSATFLY
jgi:dual specificity protein kinase YAK1